MSGAASGVNVRPDQIVAVLASLKEAEVAGQQAAEARIAQIDAVIALLTPDPTPRCPKCGADRLIPTDDRGRVCDVCTHAFELSTGEPQ